jgi:hypothetical protein
MESSWYLRTDDAEIEKPLKAAAIRETTRAGAVAASTLVRRGVHGAWVAAEDMHELSESAGQVRDGRGLATSVGESQSADACGMVVGKTASRAWLVVAILSACLAGMLGFLVFQNGRLPGQQCVVAKYELPMVIEDTRASAEAGRLGGDERIEQQLRLAQSNSAGAGASVLERTRSVFEEARAEREADGARAKELLRAATEAIGKGQLDDARGYLDEYILNEQASEKKEARALLMEIDLATSESSARRVLLPMSATELARFQEEGIVADETFSSSVLGEVRRRTLRRCLAKILEEREHERKQVEADVRRREEERRRQQAQQLVVDQGGRQAGRDNALPRRRSFAAIRDRVNATRDRSTALLPDAIRRLSYGTSEEARAADGVRASFLKALGFCKAGWEQRRVLSGPWDEGTPKQRAALEVMYSNCEFMMVWEQEEPDMKTYFEDEWEPEILDLNCSSVLKGLDGFGGNRIFLGLPYEDTGSAAARRLEGKFTSNGWKRVSVDEAVRRLERAHKLSVP